MKDAFDQFWEEAEEPEGVGIPAGIYDAVMALSPEDQRDREKVNEAVRKLAEKRAKGRTAWAYLDQRDKKQIGDTGWLRLFGSKEAADKWLEENDPEGVACEYEIEEPVDRISPTTDQQRITRALRQAGVVIAEYLDPDNPRDAEATVDRLIGLLDTQELAAAKERLESGFGLRLVK
jgi:hypothetical protein